MYYDAEGNLKKSKQERQVEEEFGCHILPTVHNFRRKSEEYDPRAAFFG